YNAKVIYTDPSKAPQLIDENGNIKSGTAYVGKDGMHTIIINTEDPKNSTRSGIIGMISEEGSHIIGKIEGRQIQTGTEEKGLESTRRATNEYFTDKYKKNDIPIKAKSDGKDYSNIDFGENVGDDRGACLSNGKVLVGCKGREPRKLTPEEQLQNDRITSFIVNLTPVGKYKIAAESIIGEDLVTKQKLSPIERLMPAYSIMKGVINSVNFGVKDNNFKKNEDNKKIDNNSNKNKKPVNKELHEKINNRGEGHYLNLQADKKVGNTTTKYRNFEHISKGEIQVNGKKVEVKGGHSTRNGIIIEEKLQEYPGGSYEAKIKIPDPNNPGKYLSKTNNNGKSTMFPDHWTENRIKVEIDNVLKNPKNFRKNSKWQGATSSGVVIEVIYRERKVITAYPIDPKKISK
ncbi:hypothetical protein EII29_11025, partial [Leptotrichia sp. OH3620_COT-345]|uniref:EndoU domain-containing protein n=1 Tax=Leptotrichia sp. OH3620_COT-345 TaxID=2491048 RepID=UPI000FB7BE3E